MGTDLRGMFGGSRPTLLAVCVVPHADCVEVTGSHVGLIFNRKVYRAVAGALALPELSTATSR